MLDDLKEVADEIEKLFCRSINLRCSIRDSPQDPIYKSSLLTLWPFVDSTEWPQPANKTSITAPAISGSPFPFALRPGQRETCFPPLIVHTSVSICHLTQSIMDASWARLSHSSTPQHRGWNMEAPCCSAIVTRCFFPPHSRSWWNLRVSLLKYYLRKCLKMALKCFVA